MRTKSKIKKILHRAQTAPRKGKMLLARANRTTTHITKDVNRYITQKPYRAIGMTLVTGLCLGYLIHR